MKGTRLPLRVLYLQPAVAFGGAERQAAYCAERLPEHGIEVVPVVGPGRAIVDALMERGVGGYVYRADMPADQNAPRSLVARAELYARYLAAYLSLARDLEREVLRRRCDLVYASRPFAWVVAARVGERTGVPVVWRAGTMFEHWAQPAALSLLARRRPPRAVVYTSEAVRREIGQRILAPSFVLHNGVDVARFSPWSRSRTEQAGLRRALGIDPGAPVVAIVARIAPEKGMDLLLELCGRLRAAAPGAVVLVAGDSGWRGRFSAACRAAGLDDTVRLLGFVRVVEEVYAAADVVVSTSTSEGCPNALLEAMAMGRAVIATRVGGTVDLVRDGADGLLVAPGDAAAMAGRVLGLLADPGRREALGRAAAARVAAAFSLDVKVAELAEILRRVVEAGGARWEQAA